MNETWVYHARRREQHAVSQWGYWGVNFKCGFGTSHTLLEPCKEGQFVCEKCASGVDAFVDNSPAIDVDTQPPPVDPAVLPSEMVGYIASGEDTPDDDEWE